MNEWKHMRVITWGWKVFYRSTVRPHLLCVCMCVCTVREGQYLNFSLCDCIYRESLCVYLCTEFYFASLIQKNIVYCFYSVWNDPDVKRNMLLFFLKVVTSKESLHLLMTMLEQTSLHSRVIFSTRGLGGCWFGRRPICHTWAASEGQRKSFTTILDKNLFPFTIILLIMSLDRSSY